jgi:hypothetical protein
VTKILDKPLLFREGKESGYDENNNPSFNGQLHHKHWKIEQYHRAIKQISPIEHSQVRAERGVKNHQLLLK